MKVLLAHNFYGSSAPSGENRVFETERDLLRERGHQVRELLRHSDDLHGALGAIHGALVTPWNPIAARRMRSLVAEFQPDVVHVHNTFPLLSPAIIQAIPTGVGRVLTLHNFRLFCPAGTLLRNRQPCTECLDRQSIRPAVRHGCYRGSRLATVPLATSVWLHRVLGTWTRHVDRFIVLSEFQRALMVKAGLPEELTFVKPNFFPGRPVVMPWGTRGDYVVFVGRLDVSKGVDILIRAWLAWGGGAPELRIVGSGPELASLRALAVSRPDVPITFVGQVTSDGAERIIAGAKLVVVPSRAFEGFPMVVREAFAFGTPVAASGIGPLSSIVDSESGVVFRPDDPMALLERVRSTWDAPGTLERLSTGARAAFERLYSEDVNYQHLMRAYEEAQAAARYRRALPLMPLSSSAGS